MFCVYDLSHTYQLDFTSRCDHRLSQPVLVEQGEAQNLNCLCVTNREKVETRCIQCLLHQDRKVIR